MPLDKPTQALYPIGQNLSSGLLDLSMPLAKSGDKLNTMWDIGGRLREARGNRTLGDIAHRLGISQSYLSNLETGKKTPNWDLLGRLATLYDVSADSLLGLTPPVIPKGAQPLIEAVSQLSADGNADLEEAVRRVVEEDRQRQEDVREREVYMGLLDTMLGNSESELLAQAIVLARDGDMAGAIAIIDPDQRARELDLYNRPVTSLQAGKDYQLGQ